MILSVTSALLPGLMVSHESPSWGSSTQATNDSNLHFTPSVAQDPSGNVYLFWDQNPGIHYLVTSTANINGTSSITPTLFTKNNQFDISPSALALSNGTLLLFWAGQRNGFWDIYVSRYNSGVWSTAAPVTPTLAQDKHPATLQDSTGKIWVSWAQGDTGDLGIKFVDSDSNGAWDAGETMVYDSDLNGRYSAGRYHNDTLIRGQAPANNTALSNDPKLSFSDSNGNGRWDVGEFIVYDQNLDNTFDPKLRYVDSNTNNVWDQGEAVIWDADANGTYTSHGGTAGCTSASIAFNRDCIIAGPSPANGTATKIDPSIKFFDSSGNGVWDLGETVIYDRNLNGLYDSSDTVISAAFSSDPMIKFQDLNSNLVWDPGEPVAYDSNNNNVYDSKIKFVDSNNNGKWNAGEAIVYDADNNGQYSEFIDTLIAGPTPNTGQALKNDAAIRFVDGNANGAWDYGEPVVYDSNLNNVYDGNLKFVDSNNNGIWNSGESVVSDTDLNGIFTQGIYHNDTLIAGAAPLNNTVLKQDPLVRFADTNFNQAWNQGEVVVYDTNNNHKYDTGEQVITGSTPSVGTGLTTGIGEAVISPGSPATGASLTNDSKIKYVDGNSNNVWDPGESIVYDVNNTSLYALGDPVLNGSTPSAGTILKVDPLMRFADANGNGAYDSGEALVYDENNNHLFDVLEFVIIGATPSANSAALTSGEPVVAGSLRAG